MMAATEPISRRESAMMRRRLQTPGAALAEPHTTTEASGDTHGDQGNGTRVKSEVKMPKGLGMTTDGMVGMASSATMPSAPPRLSVMTTTLVGADMTPSGITYHTADGMADVQTLASDTAQESPGNAEVEASVMMPL
ncbi:hypothetical protein GN958_ATG14495 [Phytophthora infestans]|uniref:Uncharacterized protein n=1 Tax=Phytophthora infestans TaxID=4787 RepID=A0A8S9U7P0_PHYIN|nr:hypothetical protein GN958_ATG14495 [Phytophthora infestans]